MCVEVILQVCISQKNCMVVMRSYVLILVLNDRINNLKKDLNSFTTNVIKAPYFLEFVERAYNM